VTAFNEIACIYNESLHNVLNDDIAKTAKY